METTNRELRPERGVMERERSAAWGGPFVLGLLVAILGLVATLAAPVTGIVSVLFYGGILVAVGVLEVVHAFQTRKTGPFVLYLLGGILSIVVGALLFWKPLAGLAALTLLVAGFFFASGLFRGITALTDRYANWGWDVLYAIVAVVAGIIIMAQWPLSSFWVVGTLVGIEVLFRGISLMSGALVVRRAVRRVPT